MKYKFDPEDYGYEHVENFHELVGYFGNTTLVKVIATGGEDFDRAVYWYSFCYQLCDDRWTIGSSSFDSKGDNSHKKGSTTYLGLISNKKFAEELLRHIFGTTQNDSVTTTGEERLQQNINKNRLD